MMAIWLFETLKVQLIKHYKWAPGNQLCQQK